MLSRLPTNIICQIAQYLRTCTYKQPWLQQLSQVNQRLHRLVAAQVYEYFALTDVIISGDIAGFRYVQPYLSRLLISDDQEIDDVQWLEGLHQLTVLDWGHVHMVSLELAGIGDGRAAKVVDWVLDNLVGVREVWVELDHRKDVIGRLLGCSEFFRNVERIRIIGGECTDNMQMLEPTMAVPALPQLQVAYLDHAAAVATSVVETVRQQSGQLLDMNVDGYGAELAQQLGMTASSAVYPRLERLALACAPHGWEAAQVDARCMPQLRSLYFSQRQYPVYAGCNVVRESTAVVLMQSAWEHLEIMAVDALTRGDVARMASRLPRLRVLSIGAMGNDVDVADRGAPDQPLDPVGFAAILLACPQLVDLRVEVPTLFEDRYNGFAPDGLPPADRPFFPAVRHLAVADHAGLRHLTINAWALTFDQALRLVRRLPRLGSLEWVLQFSSRHPLSADTVRETDGHAHPSLAHVCMVHTTAVRFKHVFRTNLLRFVAALGGGAGVGGRLRSLDVYGALEIAGLSDAVACVAPGCVAAFYPQRGK
ncbi:hypothetical protein FB645_001861 [Coemansia sp. IMI 203386]|nr:hypothetical protein FB645_001861 [Coemansia sp. IMI 203386]